MNHKLDMSCHLPNVYIKFQIDFSKNVAKSLETSDGRTDGHRHGIIWSFFKRAYANPHSWFSTLIRVIKPTQPNL